MLNCNKKRKSNTPFERNMNVPENPYDSTGTKFKNKKVDLVSGQIILGEGEVKILILDRPKPSKLENISFLFSHFSPNNI